MSRVAMMKQIAESSPRLKARIAGGLYLLSVATAALTELFVRGRLNIACGLIAILIMVAMTLLFYDIFRAVNRGLALLAACVNVVGLAFEALRLNPRGVDIALVFDGLYCILIGYLIFKSTFLPRILAALMALAGLGWLSYMSPALASYLSPYNLASGLLGEASVCVWLLAMGVNVQRWNEEASAAEGLRP
jgi:hypothetical protein